MRELRELIEFLAFLEFPEFLFQRELKEMGELRFILK